jgi:predicted GTPase
VGIKNQEGNVMSHSEARNHFEKARMNTADAVTIEMLDGLKHLSHAIEEDFRTLERNIRKIEESADRHRTLNPVYPMP